MAKKKILACIFDGKIVLENGKVASTPFSVSVQVLTNANKGFRRSKKKEGRGEGELSYTVEFRTVFGITKISDLCSLLQFSEPCLSS